MPQPYRLLDRVHRRRLASVAPILLTVTGLTTFGLGIASQQHAPQPSAADALPAAPGRGVPGPGIPFGHQPGDRPVSTGLPPLPAAVPVTLDVAAIDVHRRLATLGRNADGTLQVPPLTQVATPGWDKYSPTPGQRGPAVILGHVDSARAGRGVFYRLGALHIGAKIAVTRADRTVAVFEVRGVEEYPKTSFPTVRVYGNTPDPQLRLITCGGDFDRKTRSYTSNIVVYASLTGTHTAP